MATATSQTAGGSGNKLRNDTCEATLNLILCPGNKKSVLKTRLDVLVRDLISRITEEHGLKYMKLIVSGKKLAPDKRLDEQNVKNNSKVMVLKLQEPEEMEAMAVEEDKLQEESMKQKLLVESMKRSQKGFQILSERDDSEDTTTVPFLEIADHKGNPLTIPPSEKKALILAMGLHAKGRAIMKRKQHEAALCHLLQADEEFRKCGPVLLNTVDNYAVLQLDIVWCYQALQALDYLEDSKQRLQRAEECFLKCYGQEQKRLQQIKGKEVSGAEEVLFLRLYLLQGLQAYHAGNVRLARKKREKVDKLYETLNLDTNKLKVLKDMGFTDQEARLGLRACHGHLSRAAEHIRQRRKEKEELRKEKEEMRQRRLQQMQSIDTLVALGFSKRDASQALRRTNWDMDRAYEILLDDPQAKDTASSSSISPGPEGTTSLDVDLVKEVLEDIPEHEEDYLDLTLEEEFAVITKMRSYLDNSTNC